MIKQWRVSNFKSFKNPAPIRLAQINIMAGANSSGKSSIIQSMLLLKQTLQYGSANRAVALNGPLLRLGAFDDVQHFTSSPSPVSIGFDIELDEQDIRKSPANPWMRTLRRHYSINEQGARRAISLDIEFNQVVVDQDSLLPISSQSSLTPRLSSSKLHIQKVGNDGTKQESFVEFRHKPAMDLIGDESPTFAHYDVTIDNDGLNEIFGSKTDATQRGGYTSFFLPSWIAVHYNEAADFAIKTAEYIMAGAGGFSDPSLAKQKLSSEAIAAIDEWLVDKGLEPVLSLKSDVSASDAQVALQSFTSRSSGLLGSLFISAKPVGGMLATDLARLKDRLTGMFIMETEPNFSYELELPRSIDETTDFIKEFFKSGVRYLGPLRDSPRPVYQPEALESTTDVGYRGEHTAAILDLNGNRAVSYHRPPSDSTEHDYVKLATPRRGTLHDAVVEWLQYLGVADDVVTTDAGVYGNRLQVSTSGVDRLHDLTNVGVGVSQVLPIVVMALLAPKGSFLIFEQPELHLHPKVQARLADFFLALAKDDKQTLLETHSEYLVDRLRLRIALAGDDDVRPIINILFSEKSGSSSTLTPVEISEFGAITNWPKDFFEQSQQDISRLIEAAAARRKSRSQPR